MGVQELIEVWPTEASGDPVDTDAVRTELVSGVVGFIPDDASIAGSILQVDPLDADLGGLRQAYVYGDGVFKLDAADTTTAHDGVFVLVLIGGYRYKRLGVPTIGAIKSRSVTTPPDPDDVDPEDRPAYGDAYLYLTGSWGAEGISVNSIAVWSSIGGGSWQEVEPAFGPPVYVMDEDGYIRWTGDDGWQDGIGAGSLAADSVPVSAIIGCAASLMIRVENQTMNAPPGARRTGATPTAPLGGTASNINDNSDTTLTTSSALGNLSGLTVANRIVGRLAFATARDLICIEARGVLGSAVSSSNAMGLYYSTNNGGSWTQAGTGFTLSATAQNIQRTGTFAGVTDIALVTEAKNWSTATNTVAGLNAYTSDIVASVGDAYIVGPSPIGAFATIGASKVAVCEIANTFTGYTQADGDVVHDKALGYPVRWSAAGSVWVSAAGAFVSYDPIFEDNPSITLGTGSPYAYQTSTGPTTSNFHYLDARVKAVQASRARQQMKFRYDGLAIIDASSAGSGAYLFTLALYRGVETSPLAYKAVRRMIGGTSSEQCDLTAEFELTSVDTSSHDYKVRIHPSSGSLTFSIMTRRQFAALLGN